MFPTGFSKAVLEYIIFDKVRKETLQESFYNYILPYEKNIIQQCLQRRSFDDEIVQGLCDIFSDCGMTNLPSPSNIQVMILDAGKKVFIQKPFFVLKNIKIGLGEFWKVVTLTEIDTIWNLEAPTPTNVLKNIDFSGVKTRCDEIVTSYLQRYIISKFYIFRGKLIASIYLRQYGTKPSKIQNTGVLMITKKPLVNFVKFKPF